MRRLALVCLLLVLLCPTARAATSPSLRIWTANDHGMADLRPDRLVIVVIELRSQEAQSAALTHPTVGGLVLESATASSGSIALPDMHPRSAPPPFVRWAGVVSSAQPINVVLHYRVPQSAPPGPRTIRAQAQVGGVLLKASTAIRVCCGEAHLGSVLYLPLFRGGITRVYLPVWRGGDKATPRSSSTIGAKGGVGAGGDEGKRVRV